MNIEILSELSTPRPMAADRSRWLAILQSAVRATADGRPRGIRTQHAGRVAVVPIVGPIGHRSTFARLFGTEIGELSNELHQLARSDAVGAVVLDVDSPGGSVDGVPELADQIKAIDKPVIAVARTFMASAAYFIASGGDLVLNMRSGAIGSVGVWAAHIDVSGLEAKMGVKTTLVASSPEKIEGHPYAPLDDEARAQIQRSVDYHYTNFKAAVARNRSMAVLPKHGRTFDGTDAVSEGLADGILADLGDAIGIAGRMVGMGAGKRQALRCELDLVPAICS